MGLTNRRYIVGSTVSFTCDSGYNLSGADSLTCKDDASWDGTPPACVPGIKINHFYHCYVLFQEDFYTAIRFECFISKKTPR